MNTSSQLALDFSIKDDLGFENFIVSTENRILYDSLSELDKEQQAIIFIWGENGSGKSHLLQACCKKIENSTYVSLQKFGKYGPTILQGLENLSLVCLDDIEQVLQNSEWETALFDFFNILQQQGTHLVISAKDAPRNLRFALKDLQSRLQLALVYQLNELEEKEKQQALTNYASARGMLLEADIVNFIYNRSSRNMHDLIEVLDRLDKLSLSEKRKLTIPFIKQTMLW